MKTLKTFTIITTALMLSTIFTACVNASPSEEEIVINKYTFTEKELEPETNSYYFGARHYNPNIAGRFTSCDPAEIIKENPQSLNPYIYGFNNPVRYNDPTGASAKDKIKDFFFRLLREATIFYYQIEEYISPICRERRDEEKEEGWRNPTYEEMCYFLHLDKHWRDESTFDREICNPLVHNVVENARQYGFRAAYGILFSAHSEGIISDHAVVVFQTQEGEEWVYDAANNKLREKKIYDDMVKKGLYEAFVVNFYKTKTKFFILVDIQTDTFYYEESTNEIFE